ncbi:MAG TPA: PASTA domain-containing protein [Streptosporangiaceae bacterium]|nr:PASTA domain-containing protein [Streptosporangiaceae bacterium]
MSQGNGLGQLLAALDNVFQLSSKLSNWIFGRLVTVVPDVRSLPYARARQALLDCDLRVRSLSGPESSFPDDAVVLGQDPEPGQEVPRGHRVWLRVGLD